MRIKPTDRQKKRYIVFEVKPDRLKDKMEVEKTLSKIAMSVFGQKAKELGMRFIRDRYANMRGIVRVNNKYSRLFADALNKTGSFKTLGMSGILKKAEEKYLAYA